jgi:hypothetical protein
MYDRPFEPFGLVGSNDIVGGKQLSTQPDQVFRTFVSGTIIDWLTYGCCNLASSS